MKNFNWNYGLPVVLMLVYMELIALALKPMDDKVGYLVFVSVINAVAFFVLAWVGGMKNKRKQVSTTNQ